MLSVLIITMNAEASISRCLDSLAWANEIVVLDSHSTDKTPEICRQKAVKFFDMDWHGYGKQRNLALERCSGDWILTIDADEYVSTELREEILRTLRNPQAFVAFEIPRLSTYCGRIMYHGGWWPDHVLRLFRKKNAYFSEVAVHERLVTNGPIGRLQHCINHEAYNDLDHVLSKVNLYSTLSSKEMDKNARSTSILKAIGHGGWTFFRNYILLRGFLDGPEGFMLAVSSAEHAYYKYAKLYLLNKHRALS